MAFTRRHYELIAEVLREAERDTKESIALNPGYYCPTSLANSYAARLVAEFSLRLAADNGRFDRERFIRASTEAKS